MTLPWLADIHVDTQLATRLIEQQFPQLQPVSSVPFGKGWDNTAFLVNQHYIFRFPRREVAVPLLQAEINFLPQLADVLPLAIPCPSFVGEATDSFPWPFAGYVKIAGQTACKARLDDQQRLALAPSLAHFLKELHGHTDLARRHRVGNDRFERTDSDVLFGKMRKMLDELDLALPPHQVSAIQHMMAASTPYRQRKDTLVHGDLYVRHLLLDHHGGLSGVIDWGDHHIGEAATDLAIVWTFLPRSAHALFFDAYGEVDSDTWAMARLRGLFYGLVLYRFGLAEKDDDLITESRLILQRVLPEDGS